MDNRTYLMGCAMTGLLARHRGVRIDAAVLCSNAWEIACEASRRTEGVSVGLPLVLRLDPVKKREKTEGFTPRDHNKEVEEFDAVWSLYGKKGNRRKSEQRWIQVETEAKPKILAYIPKYLATRDEQYRKDFQSFLFNRTWEDKIIDTRDATDQRPITKGQYGNLTTEEKLRRAGYSSSELGFEGERLTSGVEAGPNVQRPTRQIQGRDDR